MFLSYSLATRAKVTYHVNCHHQLYQLPIIKKKLFSKLINQDFCIFIVFENYYSKSISFKVQCSNKVLKLISCQHLRYTGPKEVFVAYVDVNDQISMFVFRKVQNANGDYYGL